MTQIITAQCTPTNSFSWTDNSATRTDGFVWETQQPDNSDFNSSCAVILAANVPVMAAQRWWSPSKLDDHVCGYVDEDVSNPRRVRGYICGKFAT